MRLFEDDLKDSEISTDEISAREILINCPELISYIESNERDSIIVTRGGERYLVHRMLHELEEELSNDMFLRCGWCFIVNIKSIIEFWATKNARLLLSCGQILPISSFDVFTINRILSKTQIVNELSQ